MKKLLLILLILILAGGGAAWYFLRHKDGAQPQVLASVEVGTGQVRKVLEATGIIKAKVGAQVKIGARASGIIEQMLVKVGDTVEKGQLIAVIDDRELKAEKQEAEARLERTQSELERVQTVYPLQIDEAKADLEAAKAQASYAHKNLDRQAQLVQKDLAPQDTLDQAEQDATVAATTVQARQATLTRLGSQFQQELIQARKSVNEAEASLESVNVRISYTRIYSPMAGIVSQVAAQEGETLVSGLQVSNLITVIDPLSLEMWIYVDETDVGQVQPGMDVEFTVDAYPGRIFEDTIEQIYPEPEIRDNIVYYQAIVDLDREQAAFLRPEMTTQCQIIVQELKDVLVVPNAALKWVGSRKVIFKVLPDGKVQELTPQLGLEGLENSEIAGGLVAGDRVATQITLPEGALQGAQSGAQAGGAQSGGSQGGQGGQGQRRPGGGGGPGGGGPR